ncbi:MAG: phage tail protein [bacterium]|nr:phage tail protein [bacterium]
MPARASDPLIGFSFSLDISGKIAGYFTELSGLSSETDIVEHKVTDPAGRDFIQKIPGRTKYGDITLKRGITDVMDMWKWRQQVEKGDIVGARVNCTITMYNQALEPIAKWNLTNAWPVKISGPSLQTDGNNMGVEELTLTHEMMERSM